MIATENVSGWVRILGCRVRIANGIAELRRSPKVNGDKGRQDIVNGLNDIGEKRGGVEQTKTKPEIAAEKQFTVESIRVVNTAKER